MKSTIIFDEKYYRFAQKVLSFLMESTIVFCKRWYPLRKTIAWLHITAICIEYKKAELQPMCNPAFMNEE